MKTCPSCNGDGVVEKSTDDEQQCQLAVAGVSYLMMKDHEEVIKTFRIGEAGVD